MKRWFRRTLRAFGFELPFTRVICPEDVKTITIDGQWRAKVTTRRMFVFLEVPDEGDLRDFVPVDPAVDHESAIHESSDALEIGRRRIKGGTCVYWKPREPIVPYALHLHQRTWSAPAWDTKDMLCTELRCRMRTGIIALEMAAPMVFQAAVAFRRPRWRRLRTERSLVKYALRQLEGAGSRPGIRENRQKLEWKVVGPRVGDRFICIAFTAEGLAEWQHRLKHTSVSGRLRSVFGSAAPTTLFTR
jgi:hypothetical protein